LGAGTFARVRRFAKEYSRFRASEDRGFLLRLSW
jgi:hypothetical protein